MSMPQGGTVVNKIKQKLLLHIKHVNNCTRQSTGPEINFNLITVNNYLRNTTAPDAPAAHM
jgi:hypothetical protein